MIMSLILCPQEGCDHRISPTASTCPNCGFNTEQYFLENLGGFQHHESMYKFAHWVNHGNGTVTDTRSGLTWIRAPYGIKWHGDYFAGEAAELDWYEATKRFGIGSPACFGCEIDNAQLSREGVFENGYTRGSENFYFAGYSDWRLPTIAEYLTLQELSEMTTDFTPPYYCSYFQIVFSQGSKFLLKSLVQNYHSATYEKSRIQILGKTLMEGITWGYYPARGGAIDIRSNVKNPFLLLRNSSRK